MEIKLKESQDHYENYEVSGLFINQEAADGAVLKIKELGLGTYDINSTQKDLSTEKIMVQERSPLNLIGAMLSGGFIGGAVGSLMDKALGPWGILIGAMIAYLLLKNKRQDVMMPLGVLLSVRCKNSDWANKVNKLFEGLGAHNIYLRSEFKH